MPSQLLIMRHAKSAWDTGAPSDFDRPLAKRGIRDAPHMGAWLKKQKLIPDLVISSPAERAMQTAILVCGALDIKRKKIHFEPRIYGAGTEDLLEILSEISKKNKLVLLIGHNPGLEFLVNFLSGTTPTTDAYDGGIIKTATIAHLQMPEDWSTLEAGCATLLEIKHPRESDN
ncbi:MAG: histidine phosphatase family protein [Magnetococcus sp. DMHC-6]